MRRRRREQAAGGLLVRSRPRRARRALRDGAADDRRRRGVALPQGAGRAADPAAEACGAASCRCCRRGCPKDRRARCADPIKPSGFVDDREAGELPAARSRRRAILRGNIVHRLMQSLPDIPSERRAEAARHHIARQEHGIHPRPSATPSPAARSRCSTIRGSPRCSRPAAAPRCRSSAGSANGGRQRRGRPAGGRARGRADRRLQDQPPVPKRPRRAAEALSRLHRQLALYRAVLTRLYPDRPVRAALVWTAVPSLREFPPKPSMRRWPASPGRDAALTLCRGS